MASAVPADAEWSNLERRIRALVPEAFASSGRVLNLVGGAWGNPGKGKPYLSPVFGGMGGSWKGCFVGGPLLVQAVTEGAPDERLYGNFHDYTQLPDGR